MKKILIIALASCTITAIVTSCKKKKDNVVIAENATAPTLVVNPTGLVVLTKDSSKTPAFNMSWTPADFGYSSATNYAVQVKSNTGTWSNGLEVVVDAAKMASLPQGVLNQMLIGAGINGGDTTVVVSRIKAFVKGTNLVTYSNEVTSNVVTYNTNIVYPKLYLPGDYQDWTPSKPIGKDLAYLESYGFNAQFEGYVNNFSMDTSKKGDFKITPMQNWNYDFGDLGTTYTDKDTGSGVIGAKSGVDFKLPKSTYFLRVDTANLTWSYARRNWSLTGDATPQSWPDQPGGTFDDDYDMTYNVATGMYEITMDLVKGSIKLRYNDNWASNLGNPTGVDGDPAPLGTEIAASQNGKNWGVETGNYTIILDPITNKVTITKN